LKAPAAFALPYACNTGFRLPGKDIFLPSSDHFLPVSIIVLIFKHIPKSLCPKKDKGHDVRSCQSENFAPRGVTRLYVLKLTIGCDSFSVSLPVFHYLCLLFSWLSAIYLKPFVPKGTKGMM
jgi:hypothetical protein